MKNYNEGKAENSKCYSMYNAKPKLNEKRRYCAHKICDCRIQDIMLIFMNEILLIKKEDAVKRKISKSYAVNNFLTKNSSDNVSVAVSEAKNHSETTKNIRSDRVYYVLEGNLVVKRDNKQFVAETGDAIFIPKNTEYHFKGTFKAVVINSPAFNPEDEKITEL